jgi:hypothetical protein
MSDDFETRPVQIMHENFMRQVMDIILKEAVFEGTSREGLVTEWIEPEALIEIMGAELPEHPQSEAKLIQLIKNVIRYSVKTGHPRFINQLFSRYSNRKCT